MSETFSTNHTQPNNEQVPGTTQDCPDEETSFLQEELMFHNKGTRELIYTVVTDMS
jgi:hypothetical protein